MDKKDKKLLMLLQESGRESLTKLSKKINLSIDSTHKRLKKLINSGIINRFGIFIDPKALNYDLVVDVKIKLHNVTDQELRSIINHLVAHPHCIELISISGDFDLTCVLIAKNSKHLNQISYEIRQKFKGIIADWKTSFNLEVYKFEWYDVERL
ncbi:MAG: Lrp/AsnC family transcriptional regulator [Nanoarchaeota archaeon]|nr:Lrp/AsnC family transcriptional regulator [Nanoarchaeota archaeon]